MEGMSRGIFASPGQEWVHGWPYFELIARAAEGRRERGQVQWGTGSVTMHSNSSIPIGLQPHIGILFRRIRMAPPVQLRRAPADFQLQSPS